MVGESRACTVVTRDADDTSWSVIAWAEGARGHSSSMRFAVTACSAASCLVLDLNMFAGLRAGPSRPTVEITGFDVFRADAPYAVLRCRRRAAAPARDDHSELFALTLSDGAVLGVVATTGERLYDRYSVDVVAFTDGTLRATTLRGGQAGERLLGRLRAAPRIRDLVRPGTPLTFL